ncbi:MAG: flagellar assembly protein FliH [Arcobacter sp.]|nr:MAG: flagellar assembly protein FliH [Arcobacter sp.]
MKNNVYSNAKVIKSDNEVHSYELGTFSNTGELNQTDQMKNVGKLEHRNVAEKNEPLMQQIAALTNSVTDIKKQLTLMTTNGVSQQVIDKQVVEAIKDLKHYASFFEQASFQMETKLLKTSMAIARKIIAIEVGANSTLIAKETISNLLLKIKTASKVKIHLNPKDYEILKNDLNLQDYIELVHDTNVTIGGVVIASDLGNFDGNIEAKVSTMFESLESLT